MDEYLDCLYQYVSENFLLDARLDLMDYHRWNEAQNTAWAALKEALTPEQLRLVEDYQSACSGKRFLEDRLLFQKAVSLGKWMARP
ncbi:hypothetical protein [Oscillibacter sp.]|uniref:hypothetical protein n=1 Tax=Oscillibacter sp. TaxID=1945593 RepID=UPI002D8089E8|nr:hypothetical protein [Oscillibacter sp.]